MTRLGSLLSTGDLSERLLWPDGAFTGLSDLDSLTGGLRPGCLWVVFGVPGTGKTVLATQIARRAAEQVPTLLLSPGSTEEQVLGLLVAAEGRVPLFHLRAGTQSDIDDGRVAAAVQVLSAIDLDVRCHATPTPTDLLHGRAPARVVVVDGAHEWVDRELPSSVRDLKGWAVGRHAAVLLTVPQQMLEDDGWTPTSGVPREWEAADLILQVRRDDMFDRNSPRAGEADLIVWRHKDGPTATITMEFQGHYARFAELKRAAGDE